MMLNKLLIGSIVVCLILSYVSVLLSDSVTACFYILWAIFLKLCLRDKKENKAAIKEKPEMSVVYKKKIS